MVNKDYKNVTSRKKSAAPKKKRSGASRAKAKPKATTPGWVWLLAGLGIGLAVALGVYLVPQSQQQATAPAPQPATKTAKAAPVQTEKAPEEKPPKSRFDFYTVLPEQEVVIPEEEIKKEQEISAPKEDSLYIIQAGSFRSYKEADALKARLAFLGIEASIDQGGNWFRVRVGPYESLRELNKIRNRIHADDINTMLIRRKKEAVKTENPPG